MIAQQPIVEAHFPGFADNMQKLQARGLEFYLASNDTLRPYLNEAPYGHQLTWLDFTETTGTKGWDTGAFLNLFNVANGIAFGDRGIPMPQWVMIDLILMPSATVIAALPQSLFLQTLETSAFDDEMKKHLRRLYETAKASDYTGPIPIGGYCANPSAAPGTWVGWSLWSVMTNVGLGRALKALALSAYQAEKLDGVTQYDNTALRVHTRFGRLRIMVATVPFHTSPGSFVYENDFTVPPVADPEPEEPTFLLDPFDHERQRAMQKAIEAREHTYYVLAPGHVVRDGASYVPILELPYQS